MFVKIEYASNNIICTKVLKSPKYIIWKNYPDHFGVLDGN